MFSVALCSIYLALVTHGYSDFFNFIFVILVRHSPMSLWLCPRYLHLLLTCNYYYIVNETLNVPFVSEPADANVCVAIYS